MISTVDIAWAAGVFEGEGNVRAAVNKRSNRGPSYPSVVVDQKDRWILDKLQRLFGGHVMAYEGFYGTYHRWSIHGPLALGFMFTIYTFLSPRRIHQFHESLKDCSGFNNLLLG